jgi:TolB-like protein/DNA-binding SARP family transcriptional activator/Tfp pilus assembly protein PilF
MNSPSAFRLRLLGSPSIEVDGGPRLTGRVSQRHRLALLALLALASGRRMSRDKAVAWLWPESDQEKGRNLLSVAMYVIRTTLGDGALEGEGDELRLDAEVVGSDVADFEAALARGDHAAAVSLYAGPFLDGFFLSDAPEFEQWVSRERERLAAGHRRALEALAVLAEDAGDFAGATERWKLCAAQDPYDSRVALRLMQALERSGNRAGALQHGSVHQRMLHEEFGIAPPAEVSALVERLKREPGAASSLETPPAPVPQATPARSVEPELVRSMERDPGPAAAPQPSSRVVAAQPPRRRSRRVAMLGMGALAALLVVAFVVWRNRPAAALRERSIVVLPFSDMSPEQDNEYFSNGLTEEIITGLSGVPGLKVISRTSAMHYAGSDKPLRQIAEELNVAHVLEGSVRQSGDRVRITAQLIDARRDEHLWAQTYDDDLRDIFQVQEQIARQVVQALQVELGERGQTVLVREGTRDPEAYQLYRRARYLWNTRTREGHARAAEYYRQAIARDSGYADAYAGLADTYLTSVQVNVSSLPPEETYARAKWAVERALALDDKSADAHATYAISLHWQHNWPGAERAFRRALQLNPNHASAHTWYSLLLSGLGRPKEALEESRRAYELDPFAVVTIGNYGWQCHLSRDVECAIEQFRRTTEIGTTYGRGYQRLGLALVQKGMLDEAQASMQRAIALSPERPDFVADLAYIQALRGETAAALETLRRAKADPFEPFNIARAYVALRQPDSAFAWLERSNWQWTHRADRRDPGLDAVRSDPRFARLSARIDRDMGLRQ